jgi:proline iminopeptidase
MNGLFPPVEPYNLFYFPVSDGHTLYVEEAGCPTGQPVVFLHGGPGGGFSETHRRLFDPQHYRIILLDQRGAGKSTPHASLIANTTWHLVADLEALRQHLQVDQWVVFGGSWGSTLALAYAQKHPESVKALVLRGIFLCRPAEIAWFYQEGGTSWIFPQYWHQYESVIPEEERHNMLQAYYKRLTSPDESVRLNAAKAWSKWEGATCKLLPLSSVISEFEADHHALAMARIECHYFMHDCWLAPDQLLQDAGRIQQIPTWIVHGQYDVICPAKNAWELSRALPAAKFTLVPDAGHAYDEPGILDALISATQDILRLSPSQC